MTKPNFKRRNLNRDGINDGQWFQVVDFDGTDFGKFKLRSMSSEAYEVASLKARKRLSREQAILIRSGTREGMRLAHQTDVRVFIDAVLVDWEVTDQDGKPIPYSPETAFEWFTEEDGDGNPGDGKDVFGLVQAVADNIRNFRRQEQEDVSGNSGAVSNGKGSSETATSKSSAPSPKQDAA